MSGVFYPSLTLKQFLSLSDTTVRNSRVGYCELYYRVSDSAMLVKYFDASGVNIVDKSLNFSGDPFKPESEQHDFRFGEKRIFKKSAELGEMTYQKNADSTLKKTSLPLRDIDVNDAGFNEFIVANWERLALGDVITFSYASLLHRRNVTLRIKRSGVFFQKRQSLSVIVFDVSPKNVFMRILGAKIVASYDKKTRKLMYYEGTVNVKSAEGKSQRGLIVYEHYP